MNRRWGGLMTLIIGLRAPEGSRPRTIQTSKEKSREAIAARLEYLRRSLESPPQRELNQPRIAVRLQDLPKRTPRLDIRHRGIAEVRVVPYVKEVRREAHVLPLPDLEMLQERHIPVLLKRPMINIASQISEPGRAEVGIG